MRRVLWTSRCSGERSRSTSSIEWPRRAFSVRTIDSRLKVPATFTRRTRHAGCVKRLNALLGRHVQESAIVGVQDPVVLAGDTELYPDVVLLRPRPDFYSQSHPRPADVLLVIEVADTTLPYDRGVKLPRYSRAGIPEVWVVDLQDRVVDVYRRPASEKYLDHERLEPGQAVTIPGPLDQQLAVSDVLP